MTVFVDDMYLYPMGQFGRMKMSHMVASTTEELMAMADKIGVARKWVQQAGTADEHFDVAMSARVKAIAHGVQAITLKELAMKVRERRMNGTPI